MAKHNKYKIALSKADSNLLSMVNHIWLTQGKIMILRGYSNIIASESDTCPWKLTYGKALDDSSLYSIGIFVNWGLSEMLRLIN